MPLISSSYRPPLFFRNGHLSTIYSGLIRKVENLEQSRERIGLPDNDFLDLDWSYAQKPSKKLVIHYSRSRRKCQKSLHARQCQNFERIWF